GSRRECCATAITELAPRLDLRTTAPANRSECGAALSTEAGTVAVICLAPGTLHARASERSGWRRWEQWAESKRLGLTRSRTGQSGASLVPNFPARPELGELPYRLAETRHYRDSGVSIAAGNALRTRARIRSRRVGRKLSTDSGREDYP